MSIEPGGRIPQERNTSVHVPLSGLQPGFYTLVVDAGTAGSRRPAATRQIVLRVGATFHAMRLRASRTE